MKLNKMREEMSKAFLEALKQDEIPWRQQWASASMTPRNAVSHAEYHNSNALWLACRMRQKGYEDPRWCTYNQASNQGWKVRKGEKGTKIEFWSLYDKEEKRTLTTKEAEKIKQEMEDWTNRIKPVANVYTVFNAEQMEGVPELQIEHHELDSASFIAKRDLLIENMDVTLQEGQEGAFYNSQKDVIHMPDVDRFENEYAYISTFLHEAGHATGHESRLNRDMTNAFGTAAYAKEELRAEIASAFTAQTLGIDTQNKEHMENHKAYVQNWVSILEEKPEELFAAIRDAEKISDYLIEKGEFEPAYEIVSKPPAEQEKEKGKQAAKKENTKAENKAIQQKKFYTREESERMTQWLKENISIVDVCSSFGYSPVRVGQRYYSLKEHDSVRLDINKNCFYWNSMGEKGSVIDACAAFGSMDKAEAFHYLYNMAGGREAVYEAACGAQMPTVSQKRETRQPEKEKSEYHKVELPNRGTSHRNVYAYLGKTRQISNDIITEFIKKDMLYQDELNNCVFVSRDKQGEPVFACKRGTSTYKRFVADCKGNDYSKGFYVDNGADKLFVGESVIDIMSKMTILQKGGMDYHAYNYLAMAGTQKQEPIQNVLKDNPQIKEISLGLDNDKGGLKAITDIEHMLADKEILVERDLPEKAGQDWNDVLRSMTDVPKTQTELSVSEMVKQMEKTDDIFSMVNKDAAKAENGIWKNQSMAKQPMKMIPGLER